MRRLHWSLLVVLLGIGFAFTNVPANASAGSLDTTFGNGGVTVTTLASSSGGIVPFSVQMQSDGKILVLVDVVGGSTASTEVLRFTTNGELDTTFGSNGIATLPTTLAETSMAIQSNGQIVVAGIGSSAFDVERLNTNGSVDKSFGRNGLASVSLGGRGSGTQLVALLETSGDLVVVGQLEPTGRDQPFQTLLARFTSAGALDSTFGSQGSAVATAVGGATALAELSSGDILVVNGQETAQFTSTGSLESSVTGGSIVASAGSQGSATAASTFQTNGDFLFAERAFVGEESRAHNASAQVLRSTSTGASDSSFADPSFHFAGSGGNGIEAQPTAMAIQSNGDIVVVGSQTTTGQSGTTTVNGLARLTASGELDTTFGENGTITNNVPSGTNGLEGVVIQPSDGNIVAIGLANNSTALTISRFLAQ